MVNNITITRRDGTKEIFDADRINRSIERACRGLSDPIGMVTQIATETHLTLYDGITEDELDEATINAALQNAQLDPDFDTAATRILIKTMYKRVLGDYKNDEDLKRVHVERFPAHILELIDAGLIDKRLGTLFNLKELAEALDPRRDDLYKYSGASTMANRYMVKNEKQQAIEIPQYFWMRVAMGLSLSESEPTKWAKKFYDKMSKLEYLSAGSTNLGAGTPVPKLSNCFLMEMHDNMEHIGKTVSDVLLLSKATGGIGLSVTKLRANGSILKSSNTVSSGPIPFMHIIDSSIRAVQRGGKKKGALCFYMENWHLDFQDFLDLKQNAGDDYRRTRTANTAVYLSDEFMRRVVKGEDWYLFDPNEVKDLPELYGQEFAKRYCEYVEMAKAGKLKLWDKLPARQQYKNILVSLETTSHPWLTWKDTINVRALNNNTGTIHSSNLCTEVTLPQDKDNIAVCNLISINLSRHIINGQVDWHKLEESARLATRQLDNLIDINVLPVPEARKADDENRAVGLGLMGFAESIERMGFSYEDEEAFDFTDKIFEFISYMAIDESANLAKERGVYKNFEGSGWSKGLVPVDTMSILEAERGVVIDTKKGSVGQTPMLDWDTLRSKVKKGVRNATLMAVAPNANIGLVAGTSPGIDPRFAQIFSRNKISGKYLEVNTNMVADLKKLGLWDKYRDEIIKHYGDLEPIAEIPEDIKRLYKTSFAIDPFAFIEVAARAQKWVDQAISRNMYLETRDIDKVMNIYQGAWERGLKTTYYLHMKPRHSAEQSTIKVNKSEAIGKKGFAALSFAAKPKEEMVQESQAVMEELPTKVGPDIVKKPEFVVHGPVDPQDANICEGCE
ncbi:MAG: ribonucleoside-diphosphate reductase subunit alpha [Candidatus Paceibacterota bacterium]